MNNFESSRLRLIKPSPAITISTAAKEMSAAGQSVIDLSIGEPDFDTPANIVEAAIRAMKRGETRYTPPDGTNDLKEAVIEKFRRENKSVFQRANITCANGAKQIVFNALMATLEQGEEVICPAPFWVSYPDITILAGGIPRIVECPMNDGFKLTPQKLESSITSATRWLILNSPSNPSGATYTCQELKLLGEVLLRYPKVLILSDEIYDQIYYADEPFTSFAAACPELAERTVIVNGVAKTYAMTGWRIGYAAAPPELAKLMGKIQSQSTSNPCSISQAAAVEALTGPQDFVSFARSEFRERRDLVISGLSLIDGIETTVPDGAFYVFPRLANFVGRRTEEGCIATNDTALASYLLKEAKVACVQGAAFGHSPHVRMSFATSRQQLSSALNQIRNALEALR